MKWFLALLLIVLLQACATKRIIISEPEIIDAGPELSCPKLPVHLLRPCAVLPLPMVGVRWVDLIEIIKDKDLQQQACNDRFIIIVDWQDANIGQ